MTRSVLVALFGLWFGACGADSLRRDKSQGEPGHEVITPPGEEEEVDEPHCVIGACEPEVWVTDFCSFYFNHDATHLYWVDHIGDTGINKVNKTTGELESDGLAFGFGPTVDEGNVFWLQKRSSPDFRVMVASKQLVGGSQELAPLAAFLGGQLVVDDEDVYWTVPHWDSSIKRVGKSGGPVHTVMAGDLGVHIDLDDTHVYWENHDAIMRAPKDSGVGEPVSVFADWGFDSLTGSGASGLVVDETHVYWASGSSLLGHVYRVAKAGGAPEIMTEVEGYPITLVLEGNHLYGAVGDGNTSGFVYRLRKDATADIEVLAADQFEPTWVRADSLGRVFWITGGMSCYGGEEQPRSAINKLWVSLE